MKASCGSCRFWVLTGEAGDCRRRAPTITKQSLWPSDSADVETALIAYWPNTGETEWCGEYEEED